MNNKFDLAIIGGGISGCALLYTMTEYSDIGSIAIIEKESKLASISSNAKANSQTIHDGSIETNYTAEKAKKVRLSANKIRNFALKEGLQNKVVFNNQKMAIGVGDEECEYMKNRHEVFKDIFEGLEFFDKETIKKIEPKLIEGLDGNDRTENVVGSGYREAWCAMNFELMAHYFAQKAKEKNPKNEIFLNFLVKDIKSYNEGYEVIAENGEKIQAKFVLVNAGSFSLPLAQKMGYGLDLGCLPIAGSFYFVPNLLRGKVYCVQNPKLPFAALHGDPDVAIKDQTRIGPTALAMPKLERGKHVLEKISFELIKMDFKKDIFGILFDLFKDSDIRNYVLRNIVFEFPVIGKKEFLKDARKIIPSLKLEDITYAKGFGEVRPQVLDMTSKKLELGEKKIKTGRGITFNMTPSPGATSCLQNAMIDSKEIASYLNIIFDEARFLQELSPEELTSL